MLGDLDATLGKKLNLFDGRVRMGFYSKVGAIFSCCDNVVMLMRYSSYYALD